MRKRWTHAVPPLLVLATLLTPACQAKDEDLPDWVTAAMQNTLPAANRPAAGILYREETRTVPLAGRQVERIRVVLRILRQGGRNQVSGECSANFDLNEKLHFMRGWAVGADGRTYPVRQEDFYEFQPSGAKYMQMSVHVRQFRPPAADPGSTIACEYEKETEAYTSEDTWIFGNDIPVAKSVFEIDLPATYSHAQAWHEHAPVAPTETTPGHLRWELDAIAPVELNNVALAPPWLSLAGRMTVNYRPQTLGGVPDRWRDIGNWYTGLVEHRPDPTAEIAAEAARLTAGKTDLADKLQAVGSFVQQGIRYYAVEFGIGGLQPHAAPDVYRNRYGDCKDKATLVIAMLSSLGIEAHYVIVDHRRGVVDPAVPSIMADHAITAIQIPAGYSDPRLQALVKAANGKQYLIFDPTNDALPLGLVPDYEQGSYGLFSAGTESQVLQIPVLAATANEVNTTGRFTLTPTGDLSGHVVKQLTGDTAADLRLNFKEMTEQERKTAIETKLRSDLANVSFTTFQLSDLASLHKDVVYSFDIKATSYAQAAGDLLILRPRVLHTLNRPHDDKPRAYPFDFQQTGTWTDDFEIALPDGYHVDELPESVSIDNEFASYHSTVTQSGSVLVFHRRFMLKKLTLPASSAPDVLHLLSSIQADEGSSAILKRSSVPKRAD